MRRSTEGPSTVVSHSNSIPSSTKNAFAASRFSTTIKMLSIRLSVISFLPSLAALLMPRTCRTWRRARESAKLPRLILLWRHGGRLRRRQRTAARVGRGMTSSQQGQTMVRASVAKTIRRARGRLAEGGKGHRFGRIVLLGRRRQRIAPDQADQRQVAVQPRPTPPLIVAQAQLLLAVLVKPLDRPPGMGPLEQFLQGRLVQTPGEPPPGVTALPGQWPFPDQPAAGSRHGGVAPME